MGQEGTVVYRTTASFDDPFYIPGSELLWDTRNILASLAGHNPSPFYFGPNYEEQYMTMTATTNASNETAEAPPFDETVDWHSTPVDAGSVQVVRTCVVSAPKKTVVTGTTTKEVLANLDFDEFDPKAAIRDQLKLMTSDLGTGTVNIEVGEWPNFGLYDDSRSTRRIMALPPWERISDQPEAWSIRVTGERKVTDADREILAQVDERRQAEAARRAEQEARDAERTEVRRAQAREEALDYAIQTVPELQLMAEAWLLHNGAGTIADAADAASDQTTTIAHEIIARMRG